MLCSHLVSLKKTTMPGPFKLTRQSDRLHIGHLFPTLPPLSSIDLSIMTQHPLRQVFVSSPPFSPHNPYHCHHNGREFARVLRLGGQLSFRTKRTKYTFKNRFHLHNEGGTGPAFPFLLPFPFMFHRRSVWRRVQERGPGRQSKAGARRSTLWQDPKGRRLTRLAQDFHQERATPVACDRGVGMLDELGSE